MPSPLLSTPVRGSLTERCLRQFRSAQTQPLMLIDHSMPSLPSQQSEPESLEAEPRVHHSHGQCTLLTKLPVFGVEIERRGLNWLASLILNRKSAPKHLTDAVTVLSEQYEALSGQKQRIEEAVMDLKPQLGQTGALARI